jgi:hypothetical protein
MALIHALRLLSLTHGTKFSSGHHGLLLKSTDLHGLTVSIPSASGLNLRKPFPESLEDRVETGLFTTMVFTGLPRQLAGLMGWIIWELLMMTCQAWNIP